MTSMSTEERQLICVRCSYAWTPRKEQLPKRCPGCRSIKWNDSNLRVTCLRCDHVWNSHDGNPKRCPKCGSHQWNVPASVHTCKRCGRSWESKGNSVPKRCPSCFSKKWDVEREPDEMEDMVGEYNDVDLTILEAYRAGKGCIDISIITGVPFSSVRAVIMREMPGTIPRP